MSRAQLPKVYLRLDPQIDAHPDHHAMLDMMLWANRQPVRGYFRTLEKLLQLLGRERLDAAIARRDLVEKRGRGWYLDGWAEWQEGDLTVGERVRRVRAKRQGRNSAVTPPLHHRKPPSVRSALVRSASSSKKTPDADSAAATTAGATAAAAAGGGGWCDYDPGKPEQLRLVARCEELAAMLARHEEREPTDDDRREVLKAVSTTAGRNGHPPRSIEVLRTAPQPWVEESLRACDQFEQDHREEE